MPVAEFERLLHFYEHGPCSMCREGVVELLLDYDALPAQLSEECRFDANPELRKLIRQHFGPQE